MANRQALRDLQTRLATRLQAARSEGASVAWLAVEAGGARYLFPLGQAGEIFPWAPVQPVPYTARWFLGVANLRGGLSGVVDLAAFAAAAAAGPAPAPRSEAAFADTSLLALNAALGVPCALVVDRLTGLRGGDAFVSVRPPPAGAAAWHGHVYLDAQQVPWQEIDLQALAQDPLFIGISS